MTRSVLVGVFLLAPVAAWAQAGSATVTQTAIPGATTSVNTVSPTIIVQGPVTGSVPGRTPFTGTLTLRDAVRRGLDYNLGSVNVAQLVKQARSQQAIARS